MPSPLKVTLELDTPAQILERVYPNGQLGGIRVDGLAPASLGTIVSLVVRVKEPVSRSFTVRARLAWARHKASSALKESFGLDFLSEDARGRERLIDFASGKASPEALRAEDRISVALPVVLTYQGHARKETLADLSPGGAFLRTGSFIPLGSELELALRPPRSLTRLRLRARVAWIRRSGEGRGFGLAFAFDDAKQAERLSRVLERIKTAQGVDGSGAKRQSARETEP